MHCNISLFKQSTRRTNYANLFCYKILHISGIFSAHYQEFSTVYSALVSFMQVFDDRFQAESEWNCSHYTLAFTATYIMGFVPLARKIFILSGSDYNFDNLSLPKRSLQN